MKHSEVILDVFRFCIRRDPVLSKLLDERPESLDVFQSNPTDTVRTNPNAAIAPQPSFMEVDIQSRLDMLLNKNVAVSEFERTLDGLKGDG